MQPCFLGTTFFIKTATRRLLWLLHILFTIIAEVTRFFAEYDGNEEILQAHNYSVKVASNIYMNVIFFQAAALPECNEKWRVAVFNAEHAQ
jgi:hypothetical protein